MTYVVPIEVDSIVMEASTSEDKQYMRAMNKDDVNQINATLVQKLYESVLKHNNCDFGDIPNSNGDIYKVKGVMSSIECLDILKDLHEKHGIPTTDIETIKTSISIMNRHKRQFETAFKLKNDYLVILYNTIVMAIIDGTSMLVADYTSYMVTPNEVTYKGVVGKNVKRGTVSIENLAKFNALDKSGSLDNAMNAALNGDKKASAGTRSKVTEAAAPLVIGGLGAITVITLVSLKAVITLVREVIFYFYHLRVKTAEYLEVQASFLEMNRLAIENSNRPASQKKEIIRKQEAVILKLRRISDKLKIKSEDIQPIAKKELNNDNSTLSLNSLQKQMADDRMNGNPTVQIF